jgi:hypothetical protein
MKKKMYLLVRSEFASGYVVAQSVHAISKFALEYPDLFKEWNNETVVILGVRFPQGLNSWSIKLNKNNKPHSIFYEPDQRGQPTALVCYDTGEVFKDLRIY